jgi:hypothetical protein
MRSKIPQLFFVNTALALFLSAAVFVLKRKDDF